MSGPTVPGLARWMLARVLARADREYALGDLEEEFHQIAAERGGPAARRWYWFQLRSALLPSVRRRARAGRKRLAALGRRVGAALHPGTSGVSLRQARRALRRRPHLVAASALTLSLGVGFATAIFSVVYEVVLKPLPYPDGDRLVQIWNTYDSWRGHEVLDPFWDRVALSYPEYRDLAGETTPYEALALYADVPMPLTGLGDPREVTVGIASRSLFDLLGVEPVLGRTFAEDEEGPGAPRVTLLAHQTWVSAFGGSPDVLGHTLTLAGGAFAVIGVLPPGFALRSISSPLAPDRVAWVPLGALDLELGRGNHHYEAIGRLADGIDLVTATTATGRILANGASPDQRGARVTPRKTEESGSARAPLILLLGGVGLLLLIACGNFATLLIGEAVKRRSELATRYALGAERGRILWQLGLESTALGLLGGLGAYPVTVVATRGLLALAPRDLLLPPSIPPDWRVLAGGLVLGAVSGAVFGVAPAAAVRRDRLQAHLRRGARGLSLERHAVRNGVLVAQLALSLVLLVTSGLLVRGLTALDGSEVGYDAERLWRGRVLVSSSSRSPDEARAAYHRIVEGLAEAPGIEAVSLASALPFSRRGGSSSFQVVGREVPASEKSPEAVRRTVLPGYHELMGIPLLEGRYLREADRVFEAPAVVVSRALAERYWPAGGAVRARIRRDAREWEIVGVVGDVRHGDLREEHQPTMYVPFDVAESPFEMSLVVRSALPAEAVRRAMRDAVAQVDARVPVEDVRTGRSLIEESTRTERFRATLLTTFALLATILCGVGVFANTVRVVAARERELGIRIALGARRHRLVGDVVREESVWMLPGLALGTVGGLLAGRSVGVAFDGVEAFDPLSLAVAVGTLGLAAVGAVVHAARRGASVDPVAAIRSE